MIEFAQRTADLVQGFWIVQYEGVQGNGGGVAFFIKGKLFGGDTGFVYTGTYQTDEKTLSARVRNFLPEVASVFGIPGDYACTWSKYLLMQHQKEAISW